MKSNSNQEKSANEVYEAAIRTILRRPHCEKELSDKLHKKGFFTDEISDTLEELRHEGHLNDSKLAVDLVEWHINYRPMGRRGLYFRLLKKGFKKDDIDHALEPITDEKEFELARQLAERRALKTGQTGDKVGRSLLSRGFSNSATLNVLENFDQFSETQET